MEEQVTPRPWAMNLDHLVPENKRNLIECWRHTGAGVQGFPLVKNRSLCASKYKKTTTE
jgi:hypothetical protein